MAWLVALVLVSIIAVSVFRTARAPLQTVIVNPTPRSRGGLGRSASALVLVALVLMALTLGARMPNDEDAPREMAEPPAYSQDAQAEKEAEEPNWALTWDSSI